MTRRAVKYIARPLRSRCRIAEALVRSVTLVRDYGGIGSGYQALPAPSNSANIRSTASENPPNPSRDAMCTDIAAIQPPAHRPGTSRRLRPSKGVRAGHAPGDKMPSRSPRQHVDRRGSYRRPGSGGPSSSNPPIFVRLASMASYRFESLGADATWSYVGEEEVHGEMSSREAFHQLVMNQDLLAGKYRYKRSDESASHPPGYFTLAEDGSISAG